MRHESLQEQLDNFEMNLQIGDEMRKVDIEATVAERDRILNLIEEMAKARADTPGMATDALVLRELHQRLREGR